MIYINTASYANELYFIMDKLFVMAIVFFFLGVYVHSFLISVAHEYCLSSELITGFIFRMHMFLGLSYSCVEYNVMSLSKPTVGSNNSKKPSQQFSAYG